jgi:broad specificity phosphatase PhoE
MGEVVLVRHGQANSAEATTEAEYDRLSDLGRQQAAWLGEWFRAQGEGFDAVLCGSLARHRQTVEAMGLGAPEVDARLNEMDYFGLAEAHRAAGGAPVTPESFPDHIVEVIHAWRAARIRGAESFEAFETRVAGALHDAAREGRRVLCVTSGGTIGMALRHVLGLDPTRMAHLLVPIRNTSVHRLAVRGGASMLSEFNAVPHLLPPERSHAVTTY